LCAGANKVGITTVIKTRGTGTNKIQITQ
jgi:hypothetical protein